MMEDTYCPNCGEHVDRGLSDKMGMTPCDHCQEEVEPISDSKEAGMPHKAKHPIKCSRCGDYVQLAGLHMGRYSDGVIVACSCDSMASVPYELGEPELPQRWEIVHDAELYPKQDDTGPKGLEKFA